MELKLASIFSDNMVLQRNKNINIWGTSSKSNMVSIKFNEKVIDTKVINNEWRAILPSMEAGGPYSMEISDGNEDIILNNIMIGEVWVASGQSNMELELQNSKNGKVVVKSIKNYNIRFYNVPRLSYIDDEFFRIEDNTTWQECNKENVSTWSAVGYYFAKKLSEELGVTVGIVGCNFGGTSASAWISRDRLEEDVDTRSYVEEYEKVNEGRSFEEYLNEVEEYNVWYKEWQERVDECYKRDPNILWSKVLEIAGENRWPEPLGPKSPYRPGGLYKTMLRRIIPYTIGGVLYYQGESDDHKPKIYGKLLKKLIEQWREDWEDDELPFMIVQLPMFIGREDEDKKNWPIIREEQMRVHKRIKNTGIAVIIDCGEFDNIHPLDKETVGYRLTLQALLHVYKKNIKAYGPTYREIKYLDKAIEVSFDNAEDGIINIGNKANGFEIAGENKKFFEANIIIENNKIIISSSKVDNPKYVRYAWTNYGEVNIFNKIGLPMAPFRTNRNDG